MEFRQHSWMGLVRRSAALWPDHSTLGDKEGLTSQNAVSWGVSPRPGRSVSGRLRVKFDPGPTGGRDLADIGRMDLPTFLSATFSSVSSDPLKRPMRRWAISTTTVN
jgi:hypothetical protein